VYDCASEIVLIGIIRKIGSPCEMLGCIGLHVEFLGELQVTVDLYFPHLVIVELEAFNDDSQYVRKRFDTESFLSFHFFLANFTEVSIVPI
jgi:hypothetical protein